MRIWRGLTPPTRGCGHAPSPHSAPPIPPPFPASLPHAPPPSPPPLIPPKKPKSPRPRPPNPHRDPPRSLPSPLRAPPRSRRRRRRFLRGLSAKWRPRHPQRRERRRASPRRAFPPSDWLSLLSIKLSANGSAEGSAAREEEERPGAPSKRASITARLLLIG